MRAHKKTMDGISGHADGDRLISWISHLRKTGLCFVVHGSEESCVSFSDVLNTQLKHGQGAFFRFPV